MPWKSWTFQVILSEKNGQDDNFTRSHGKGQGRNKVKREGCVSDATQKTKLVNYSLSSLTVLIELGVCLLVQLK